MFSRFYVLLFCVLLVCQGQGSDPEPASENDLTCSLCKTVMELLDAYITDETTEQQVADALLEICSILPSPLDVECEVMIEV